MPRAFEDVESRKRSRTVASHTDEEDVDEEIVALPPQNKKKRRKRERAKAQSKTQHEDTEMIDINDEDESCVPRRTPASPVEVLQRRDEGGHRACTFFSQTVSAERQCISQCRRAHYLVVQRFHGCLQIVLRLEVQAYVAYRPELCFILIKLQIISTSTIRICPNW